jgi:hypothetical protein
MSSSSHNGDADEAVGELHVARAFEVEPEDEVHSVSVKIDC